MKARLPKGYNNGGTANLQQLAVKAQKMQKEMDLLTEELGEKEYTATASGGAVKVTINGKLEVKNIELAPEIVNEDDVEMLSDLLIVAVNEAIRNAVNEKNEKMDKLSAGLSMPGIF
ncbi:dNA-binding protein YbaB/EbfC family [Clostridium sp. CAG:557]|jgi:DNA-binding YbaB/EbfC family protein|nr:dNA-binding protein YbaB/EbfC family [Clostridium sp. CAG:557]